MAELDRISPPVVTRQPAGSAGLPGQDGEESHAIVTDQKRIDVPATVGRQSRVSAHKQLQAPLPSTLDRARCRLVRDAGGAG